MYFLLFVLHDSTICDDVLHAWEAAGVKGVTILPSTGLNRMQNRALLEDMPIMPSLEDFFTSTEVGNRTMFTIVPDDEIVDKILEATQSVVGDLNQPNTGILIVLPTVRTYGLTQ
ncbi:MAG: hypothetical protein JEZ00_14355 [Anaerolineaceae bacterium]|nr:hypothetical protein [Anaerolineaceae bacterium]